MRILALILARGGSKRLPGKNIRPLNGKPLIVWSIDAAAGIGEISDILVSTDDPAIMNVAESAGALVPWQRPAELATDTATSADVATHALDWYEESRGKVDGLLLLQPTSPFRTRGTIERGIDLFRADRSRPVIGVSPARSHPMLCFKVDGPAMVPFVAHDGTDLSSQTLLPAYAINGAFYLLAPDTLRSSCSFYSASITPLVIDDRRESMDIDTEDDWLAAESYITHFPA